ncbi:hypothetical protein BT96DRAFT_924316 [Gymnopus androsaceus JB14]|uniref:Uncharacterized protein n=1 Tax=Gymnopus androsaceus JB14 TaxID=1447944 RepID=A0A6A4H765_9AGAR|nr:hypothetical protein BT96DRAFT_924316 [Gymnopus androsaceus JB14]
MENFNRDQQQTRSVSSSPSSVGFMRAIEEIWGAASGTDYNSQPKSYGRTFR